MATKFYMSVAPWWLSSSVKSNFLTLEYLFLIPTTTLPGTARSSRSISHCLIGATLLSNCLQSRIFLNIERTSFSAFYSSSTSKFRDWGSGCPLLIQYAVRDIPSRDFLVTCTSGTAYFDASAAAMKASTSSQIFLKAASCTHGR
jgi:hypothetical protein